MFDIVFDRHGVDFALPLRSKDVTSEPSPQCASQFTIVVIMCHTPPPFSILRLPLLRHRRGRVVCWEHRGGEGRALYFPDGSAPPFGDGGEFPIGRGN